MDTSFLDEDLDMIEVLEQPALFSNGRIPRAAVPEGLYANYDMRRQQVCDELEITVYGSGMEDQQLTYRLNAAEKELLCEKMEAYCLQQENKTLDELCQEILQEIDEPEMEMQM